MRKTILTCAALLATAAAGCGSTQSNAPKPAENIDGFVSRVTATMKAIQAGSCAPVRAFNAHAGLQLLCNAKAKRVYANFKVTGSARFGTGGVVEFTDAEAPRGGAYIVGLDEARRYSVIFAPILGHRTIGTKPGKSGPSDRAVAGFIDGIRKMDCNEYFKYSLTPPGMTQAQDCAQTFDPRRQIQPALAADKSAKPHRYGGTADFTFYGLSTKPHHYRTLVVLKDPTNGKYLVVVLRAR